MQDPEQKKIKRQYTSGRPGNVLDADYFYYDTAPNDIKDMAIVCGGHEKCAPDFDICRNTYPYFFIKFTVSGKGTLRINSQTLALETGVLTGFGPGTPHHYRADSGNPMSHIFVTFLGNECQDLFAKSALAEKHYIKVENPDETMALFQRILQLGLDKKEFSQEICCAYLRILLLEHTSASMRGKASQPISKGTFQVCKRYIDMNFSSIKSPGEIAYHCNIDVRYLSVLFKRYCHTSPSQYLMRLKLNKAANLLLTTDLAIKEVALKIGFDDPYHFSRNFKKVHGHSPNDYRKDHM